MARAAGHQPRTSPARSTRKRCAAGPCRPTTSGTRPSSAGRTPPPSLRPAQVHVRPVAQRLDVQLRIGEPPANAANATVASSRASGAPRQKCAPAANDRCLRASRVMSKRSGLGEHGGIAVGGGEQHQQHAVGRHRDVADGSRLRHHPGGQLHRRVVAQHLLDRAVDQAGSARSAASWSGCAAARARRWRSGSPSSRGRPPAAAMQVATSSPSLSWSPSSSTCTSLVSRSSPGDRRRSAIRSVKYVVELVTGRAPRPRPRPGP